MIKQHTILTVFLLVFSYSFSQELTFNKVKDSILSIIEKEDIPGISLAIINKKDSLYWSGGFGMADIENNIPMTKNSLMFIASTSKNFIALSIMTLVEEGKVKLTTPIKDIIPEINYKNPWKDTNPITLEMVLEHTTGFDDTRYNNFIGEDDEYLTLKELLNTYPNALHSRWKPGTMFSYSNLNYTLAGYIIEKITGMPFEAYVKQSILDPLEMNETKLTNPTAKYPNIAIPYGYDFKNQKNVPFFQNGKVGANFMQRPASFVITSSKDMLKYLNFYLSANENNSLIVGKASIDRMENGETSYDAKLGLDGRYGLGNKPGLREVQLFGHHGNAWNTSFFLYNREVGVGYYLATNCSFGIPQIRRLLTAFLFKDYKIETTRNYQSSEIAKPFEGFYEAVTSRNEMLLFFDQIRYAGNLKVESDTVCFDGGLKQRKYKVFENSTEKLISLNRVDKRFEKQRNMSSLGLMYDENNEQVLVWDTGTATVYFKKKSAFIHYFKHISLFASIPILAIATLVILIISLIKTIKRRFKFSVINTTISIATLSLALMIFIGIPSGPFDLIALGEMNLKTILFFILSMVFPLVSLIYIKEVVKHRNKSLSLWLKIPYSLICFSIIYLNVFMLQNGFVGLQFWNY
ncbi:serine hydrolase domain-containing protein [Pontimicrobium aquaticum]|uniref:Beta-lactamase family protein n=1 Tax=Pontimicrobium aquaticum TaxID=2565367 RepID=A0A4U0EYH2_9FLAO|nr:serine hydrolase domain-containing protein [Pontimicrobium aquaticum]TJY37063.1 beta-lactamase family protein [Pontimicrobium aquaticum]